MLRTTVTALVVAAVVACMSATPARAYEGLDESQVGENFLARDRAMEQELQQLRSGEGSCDGGVDYCCDDCCSQGAWFATAEATFFRYDRADGSRVGDGSAGQADEIFSGDYFASPRFTLGYRGCGGAGFRVRYWDFDNATTNPHPTTAVPQDHSISVDTYIIDFEVFKTCSTCGCDLEVSVGVRYNDFSELLINTGGGGIGGALFEPRLNAFSGWGGIVGVEGVRQIGCIGALYANARMAILAGDKTVYNVNNGTVTNDSVDRNTQGMLEFGAGYQYERCFDCCTLSLRAGVEYQHWYSYSSAFSPSLGEAELSGSSDVNFFGYTVGAGVTY